MKKRLSLTKFWGTTMVGPSQTRTPKFKAMHIMISGYTSKYEGKTKFEKKFGAPKLGVLKIQTFEPFKLDT